MLFAIKLTDIFTGITRSRLAVGKGGQSVGMLQKLKKSRKIFMMGRNSFYVLSRPGRTFFTGTVVESGKGKKIAPGILK